MTEQEQIEWKEKFRAWLKEGGDARNQQVRQKMMVSRVRLHQWVGLSKRSGGGLYMPSRERIVTLNKMIEDSEAPADE